MEAQGASERRENNHETVWNRAFRSLLGVLILGVFSDAGGQAIAQTKPTQTHFAQKPKGFFDYALGKINPQDKDYGTAVEVPAEAVQSTIRSTTSISGRMS